MTLSEARTYVSQLVDDPDQTYFTPAVLNLFLNQSLKETQKLLCAAGNNWYLKLVRRDMVGNQRDYLLPCDFLYLNRLEIRQGTPPNQDRQVLMSITLNQQTEFADYSDPPACFYLEKEYLILVPAPQNNSWGLYLWYSYLVPELLMDSDEADLPEEFNEFWCQKAANLCFIKDDRAMDNIFPTMQETEKRLKQAAIQRVQASASKVVTTRDSGIISY
jgi:hypothetical protein